MVVDCGSDDEELPPLAPQEPLAGETHNPHSEIKLTHFYDMATGPPMQHPDEDVVRTINLVGPSTGLVEVILDSGSDVHIAPIGFGGHLPTEASSANLRDAQGTPLRTSARDPSLSAQEMRTSTKWSSY